MHALISRRHSCGRIRRKASVVETAVFVFVFIESVGAVRIAAAEAVVAGVIAIQVLSEADVNSSVDQAVNIFV